MKRPIKHITIKNGSTKLRLKINSKPKKTWLTGNWVVPGFKDAWGNIPRLPIQVAGEYSMKAVRVKCDDGVTYIHLYAFGDKWSDCSSFIDHSSKQPKFDLMNQLTTQIENSTDHLTIMIKAKMDVLSKEASPTQMCILSNELLKLSERKSVLLDVQQFIKRIKTFPYGSNYGRTLGE